jgi:hypothetical protein
MPKVELNEKELRLVLQSLEHCLATCHQKAAGGGPCEDCDAARALRDRLTTLSVTHEA